MIAAVAAMTAVKSIHHHSAREQVTQDVSTVRRAHLKPTRVNSEETNLHTRQLYTAAGVGLSSSPRPRAGILVMKVYGEVCGGEADAGR